ncbi:MAG: hypothetical protein WD557_02700 [Dehalococcoidia bacterium]
MSSLWNLMLANRYPLALHGPESASIERDFEHRQALKEMRADEKRAKRELNAADRAERGWLARRLGLARD